MVNFSNCVTDEIWYLYLNNGTITKSNYVNLCENVEDCDYVIVAMLNDGKLEKLKLLDYKNKKMFEELSVNNALVGAFEYDMTRKTNFSKDYSLLKKYFIENIGRKLLKSERTEIKKFMYLSYMQQNDEKVF